MISFLLASYYMSVSGAVFGLSGFNASVSGFGLRPGLKIKAVGTFSKLGPGNVFYGPVFSLFTIDHGNTNFLVMPVAAQAGYLLGTPVLKPFAAVEAGGVQSIELSDTSFTVWGFTSGLDAGLMLMAGRLGLSVSAGLGVSSIPFSEDAKPFSDSTITGISYRVAGGGVYSW